MIQLRPPADADNYRVKAGRFGDRFYIDPLPADDTWEAAPVDDVYPAISTVKKAVGNDWSRAMAKRLSQAPSQLVEIGNVADEFERKERISLLSEVGLQAAGNRGTAVHAHAEALLGNRIAMYEMNDVVKPYIRTLDAFFAAYNPKPIAAEFVAIHRTLNNDRLERANKFGGYGGTGDAVVEIDGEWWLVDWKTRPGDGNHSAYAEEGGQVSAYAGADYWIVADPDSQSGAKRIPVPKLAGGLIVSIKPDSYECYPIDLEEGFEYWTDLHHWWQGLRSGKRAIGRKWGPRVGSEASQLVEPNPLAPAMALLTPAEPVTEEPKGWIGPGVQKPTGPTPAINRQRFDAMADLEKQRARETFARFKVNPNDPETAWRVAKILDDIETRPSLRDMQETRAEQEAARPAPAPVEPATPKLTEEEVIAAEGGPAPDFLVAEAKLMFDMVLTAEGRQWTGLRVKEANVALVPFQLSALKTMRRVNLYLALCRWAAWRQEGDVVSGVGGLVDDEMESNIAFTGMVTSVERESGVLETRRVTLGERLGLLSPDEAERLATLVAEVVPSPTDDNVVIEPETQPETKPKSKRK